MDINSLEYYDNILSTKLKENELYNHKGHCIKYELIIIGDMYTFTKGFCICKNKAFWVSEYDTIIHVEDNPSRITLEVYPDILSVISKDLLVKCMWQVLCEERLLREDWVDNFKERYTELKQLTLAVFKGTIEVVDRFNNHKSILVENFKNYREILIPKIWLTGNIDKYKNFYRGLEREGFESLNKTNLFKE